MRKLKIGLLGCGVVGSGFVRLVEQHLDLIRQRAESEVEISKILVRDGNKPRPGVDPRLITTHAEQVLANGADLIVELIGGTEPARSLIREAIGRRKHVVTANKAVLARTGGDLLDLASVHRVQLGFEASVCGAIPIVRIIRDGLAGDRITSITGIVNGTCNYLLTRMGESDASFDESLAEAQVLGFAEADPSLDLDGEDAAQKIAILAQLAFGGAEHRWIRREGIREIDRATLESAAAAGKVVRHVARAKLRGEVVELEAGPELLAPDHPLGRVRCETNGVVIESAAAGQLSFYGAGAGSLPSASSVLADVIDIARGMQ
ncbi:MAG TPA: homoserine dehydrogenase [Thermoanaerobaculia bacterium]|nr:homoserine dehydrogenase [Thermoanaerobaculia bacterium]